jgi:hypothetical protein
MEELEDKRGLMVVVSDGGCEEGKESKGIRQKS